MKLKLLVKTSLHKLISSYQSKINQEVWFLYLCVCLYVGRYTWMQCLRRPDTTAHPRRGSSRCLGTAWCEGWEFNSVLCKRSRNSTYKVFALDPSNANVTRKRTLRSSTATSETPPGPCLTFTAHHDFPFLGFLFYCELTNNVYF